MDKKAFEADTFEKSILNFFGRLNQILKVEVQMDINPKECTKPRDKTPQNFRINEEGYLKMFILMGKLSELNQNSHWRRCSPSELRGVAENGGIMAVFKTEGTTLARHLFKKENRPPLLAALIKSKEVENGIEFRNRLKLVFNGWQFTDRFKPKLISLIVQEFRKIDNEENFLEISKLMNNGDTFMSDVFYISMENFMERLEYILKLFNFNDREKSQCGQATKLIPEVYEVNLISFLRMFFKMGEQNSDLKHWIRCVVGKDMFEFRAISNEGNVIGWFKINGIVVAGH